MADIESRLLSLEDKNAIEVLMATLCDAADGGWDRAPYDVRAMTELFCDDAVIDAGTAGSARGIAEIGRLIETCRSRRFAFHYLASPAIEVRGDDASGRWHLIALTIEQDGRQTMLGGILEDNFVRTGDGWRIQKMKLTIAFMNAREQGWDDPVHQALFRPGGIDVVPAGG